MKNILAVVLRYFSFLLCGLLLCAGIYYLFLFDRTVVLTGFSHTGDAIRPPLSAVLPIIPQAAVPVSILACFYLCLSFLRKDRTRASEGFAAVLLHGLTWAVILPACFHTALTLEVPPMPPPVPLTAGFFRPESPGSIRFYTNVNPDRGFVLNTLNDAERVTSFDETRDSGGVTADALSFSDPLVAARLIPPFWLTALLGFIAILLQHLSTANLAGTVPWIMAATLCLPLSALVVQTHLSRHRLVNFCGIIAAFLLIIGSNIAWVHFGLDTFFSPLVASLFALLPANLPPVLQSPPPAIAAVNLLLAILLYCCGIIGSIVNKKRQNTPEAFS